MSKYHVPKLNKVDLIVIYLMIFVHMHTHNEYIVIMTGRYSIRHILQY